MDYASAGLSIIPIKHGEKTPAIPWKPNQNSMANNATIHTWFNGENQLAIVCGAISGGLVVLDFDAPEFFEPWCQSVGDLADGLPVQKTGRGGYHVLFRCPNPRGNEKLAWKPDDGESTGRKIAIETRGEGGYILAAPSIHPNGNRYEWLEGDPLNTPTLTQEDADRLLAAARALDAAPFTRHELEQREAFEAQAYKTFNAKPKNRAGGGVIEAFNAAHEIGALLTRHGYTPAPFGRFIRPGGKSPSVSVKDGRSCHWSSNDPLNDGHGAGGCGCHDAFDIFRILEHGGDNNAAVKAAAALVGMTYPTAPAELKAKKAPVPRIEPFQPFPVDALPEPARTFVLNSARAIGCDACYVALPLLAALASAIGNTRRIELKPGWTEPAIIWAVIVGESGTLKSPAIEIAVKPIRQRQAAAFKRLGEEMKQHDIELAKYENELATRKKRKLDGDPPEKPIEPTAERFWCDDVTIEALAALLQNRWRGLLVARDELAGWFGSFDRYSNGKGGGDVAKWLEIFGGRPLMNDRKSGDNRTTYVSRANASICGGIQPATLTRSLGIEYRNNGLLARLLLAYPPSKAKKWTEDCITHELEEKIDALFDRLYELEPTPDENGDPQPVIVRLNGAGKAAWVKFFNAHGKEQAALSGELAAAWSKLEGYAARLALVVHFIRWAANDSTLSNENEIDAESIKIGVILSQWFGNEARRIYSMMGESEGERNDRCLVEWIQRQGGAVTPRDIQQNLQRFKSDVSAAETALDELVEAGYGRWEHPTPSAKGGRPSKIFRLNPSPTPTKPSTKPTKPLTESPKPGSVGVGGVGGDENKGEDRGVEI